MIYRVINRFKAHDGRYLDPGAEYVPPSQQIADRLVNVAKVLLPVEEAEQKIEAPLPKRARRTIKVNKP